MEQTAHHMERTAYHLQAIAGERIAAAVRTHRARYVGRRRRGLVALDAAPALGLVGMMLSATLVGVLAAVVVR